MISAVLLAVLQNHEEIRKHPEIITKFRSFIDKYNLEGKYYPSEKDDQKMFCMLILPPFQSISQSVKNKLLFQTEKDGIILH